MEPKRKDRLKNGIWQKKLLPFMIGILTTLTIFFFVASFIQLYYLHKKIEENPKLDLKPALSILIKNETNKDSEIMLEYSRWITLALLEKHAWQRRYHQANVLLMSRIWTKYLGFVTGMTLAMVGAAFILGKLRETNSKLESESSLWKFSITTASPGLFLALLGTILMVTAMITHHEIQVSDGPLYTTTWELTTVDNLHSPEPINSENGSELVNKIAEESKQ